MYVGFELTVLFVAGLWAGIGVLLALVERRRAYRRHVTCSPRSDYSYDFDKSRCVEIPIDIDNGGFVLQPIPSGYETGVLEMDLSAAWLGRFQDPMLEMGDGCEECRVYFERGLHGKRYLDVSVFSGRGGRVWLRGKRLRWQPQQGILRLWGSPLGKNDRVVIMASHPDDAEIAASSFYSSPGTHVMTVTSGRHWHWKLGRLFSKGFDANLAARVRTWDSLAVPWLGGLSPERCVQLGYPDGELDAMRGCPDKNFISASCEFDRLRRMNLFRGLPQSAECSWNGLVGDLEHVFRKLSPTVIVLPCPLLDRHEDHKAVVFAVCEAIVRLGSGDVKFLLYVNHAAEAKLWPYGPAGSSMTLPPVTATRYPVYGLYSRHLARDAQNMKFLLLEAMHDLREPPQLGARSLRQALQDLRGDVASKVRELERSPNNYFRRAVRANEMFFVANLDQLHDLLDRKDGKVAD